MTAKDACYVMQPIAVPALAVLSATPARIMVLRGVHRGLLDSQIAFDLGIMAVRARTHVTAPMRKRHFCCRTQAVAAWVFASGTA